MSESTAVEYLPYCSEEHDLADIMDLVDQELSEPYNIYTFRYFLQEWPHLAWLVFPVQTNGGLHERQRAIATIVCKQDYHKGRVNRGYIAMLSVDKGWRRKGIAKKLIDLAMKNMIDRGADEIVLETEYDNRASLSLYGSMGFLKDRRLYRFYLNGKDAFRLVYPVSKPEIQENAPSSDPSHPRHLAPPSPTSTSSELSPTDQVSQPNVQMTQPPHNGTGGINGPGLGTLLEEGEIVEHADTQVDEARRRVESGLVL